MIGLVIPYGGDTDTKACIVGSMAEALHGIEPKLIIQANEKLPNEFAKVLKKPIIIIVRISDNELFKIKNHIYRRNKDKKDILIKNGCKR